MESLAEETWDVIIAGTGLVQALLALSLSRSDLKILHLDENPYYGGFDAGLSLDEAAAWAERHSGDSGHIASARVTVPSRNPDSQLKNSRAYTLSLNPQIVYAQSTFLPSLVSSTVNTQLEFMAVGPWWIYKQGKLQKVPSSREDVFADDGLSRRDKIGLMKLLRYVVQDEEESDLPDESLEEEPLHASLTSKFRLSPDLQLPILALALAQNPIQDVSVKTAISRIRRHTKSVGYFGPGFGAVVAKYAGNAEIAQVCCRACAVGGATYLLGQGVSHVHVSREEDVVEVTLPGGVAVKSKHLVSDISDLPSQAVSNLQPQMSGASRSHHSISIISSSLRHLFPPTSENGPVPAAAIVLVIDNHDMEAALRAPPIYLQVHSEDTCECPSGQCIVYATTLSVNNEDSTKIQGRLAAAVSTFINASSDYTDLEVASTPSEILWSMSYSSTDASMSGAGTNLLMQDETGRITVFPPRPRDIAFDDGILNSVEAVWRKILGEGADKTEFLRFEDRSGNQDGD